MAMKVNELRSKLAIEHKRAGRFFEAGGVRSFVREDGPEEGEIVLCIHGVPASSFLYRKMLPELASKGYRGIAIDLPGLGFSERKKDFDYTWTGLGQWLDEAVAVLGYDRFHLIIHDIGGPVGMELVAIKPERVLSVTVLNTIFQVNNFSKPCPMRPFGLSPLIGRMYLSTINPMTLSVLMKMVGVSNTKNFGHEEAKAWVEMLKGDDKGEAFLQIMRNFETTAAKEELYCKTLRDLDAPKQVIWGEKDPFLQVKNHGRAAKELLDDDVNYNQVKGKHFLQEDCPVEIVNYLDNFIKKNQKEAMGNHGRVVFAS